MKDKCKTDKKRRFTILKRFWEFLKMMTGLFSEIIIFHSVGFLVVTLMGYGLAITGIVCAGIFCLGNDCERICFLLSSILLLVGIACWDYVLLKIKKSRYCVLKSIYESTQKEECKFSSQGNFLLQKRHFSMGAIFFIACLIIAIFITFLPLVSWKNGLVYGILDAITRTMQALVVGGGISALVESTSQFYMIFSASLWIVGASLITFNIVALLAKEFSAYTAYWVWHPFSHIFVFSELNDKSVMVAESIFFGYYTRKKKLDDDIDRDKKLHKKYETLYKSGKPRFYFCDGYSKSLEEFSELISRAWRIGAVIMKRDITELNIKKGARENTFYLIGKNEERNVGQAQKICHPNKKRINKGDLKVHIYASGSRYEKLIDDSLNRIPDELNPKEDRRTTVRRMDEHSRFALDFFWEHGNEFFNLLRRVEDASPVEVRVAFLGFGDYAVELFKTICSLGQIPKCRLIIYIFDKDGKTHKKTSKDLGALWEHRSNTDTQTENSPANGRMDDKYHDHPYYELYFQTLNVEESSKLDKCCVDAVYPFTHFIVSLGDDALNFEVSTYLCQKLKRINRTPFVYAMLKNGELYSESIKKIQTEYENLYLIGTKRERYAYWTIEQEELEHWGFSVHRVYFLNKLIADFHKAIELQIEKLKEREAVISEKAKEFVYNVVYEACKDFRSEIIRLNFVSKSALEKEHESKIILDLEKELYNEQEFSKKINAALNEENPKIKEEDREPLTKLWQEVLNETRNEWEASLEKIGWDRETQTILEEKAYAEYNRKEYFRRSSKSRVIYEKLLFDLGYLNYKKTDEQETLIVQNLVSEYEVKNKVWNKAKSDYRREQIPFYSTKKTNNPDSVLQYNDFPIEDDTKIDGQYFELYNLLQKRWMVFRWSEGYVFSKRKENSRDTSFEDNEPADHVAKTHRYLKPYVEIFKDPYAKLRHTIPIIYKPGPKGNKRKENKEK